MVPRAVEEGSIAGKMTSLSAYQQPAEDVLSELGSDAGRGLTTAEAQTRLTSVGPNELPVQPIAPVWRRFFSQFQNPITILLLAAAGFSFVAWLIEGGELIPYEALTIVAIVILNGVLGYVQEERAGQAVAALQAMAAEMATVLRDGEPREIATREIVPGDVVLLEEGDSIPADGRIIASIALRVAEAALTGESTPVEKDEDPVVGEAGLADQSSMVFSGTAVAAGRGRFVVTATGSDTQIGAIAGSVQAAEAPATPLQRELDWVGRMLGIVVIVVAVVIGATIVLVDDIRSLEGFVEVLLLAVSLAVAAVPEGLTAITTVVLSLGTQRMARRRMIVRKLAAVETLGSTTVICSDKTGTLTRNEMTVRVVTTASGRVGLTGVGYAPGGEALHDGRPLADPALVEEVRRLLHAAERASNATLHEVDGRWEVQGDPTEGALVVAAQKLGIARPAEEAHLSRVGEIPFSSERKLMSTAYADAREEDRAVVLAKGAPDVLLARCSAEWVGSAPRPLTDERRRAILAVVEDLAGEALRTLGVAGRVVQVATVADDMPEDVEQELVFLGVVGMIDPPRDEARASVQTAREAGIRAVMITGDHPTTAAAIAAELGIVDPGIGAVTGADLDRLDDEELRRVARTSSTYARVAPSDKLRIVRALQAENEIVAMTGDGVNDAPALWTADIGVAMGITGTDVAKGAADMILTDDNFASIVAAVEEGRSIFANIQKFLRYLLSSNASEVLVMFFGVVLADVIGLLPETGSAVAAPLLATQILWINLVTDSGPALALGVEPDDPGLMQKPPRDPRSRVIDRAMWFDIIYVGVIMAVGTLLVADWALPGGLIDGDGTLRYAQTMTFTTLVFAQLFNVLNARSDERSAFAGLFTNRWLWGALVLSVLLQIAVVYLPFLQRAFGTVDLSPSDWLVCVGVGSTVLWLREAAKLVTRWR